MTITRESPYRLFSLAHVTDESCLARFLLVLAPIGSARAVSLTCWLKRPCSLSRTKTETKEFKLGAYIIYNIYINPEVKLPCDILLTTLSPPCSSARGPIISLALPLLCLCSCLLPLCSRLLLAAQALWHSFSTLDDGLHREASWDPGSYYGSSNKNMELLIFRHAELHQRHVRLHAWFLDCSQG